MQNQVFIIKDQTGKPLSVFIVDNAFKAYTKFNDIRSQNKTKTLNQTIDIFEKENPSYIRATDCWWA